jgi:hypothetical protein
MLIKNVTKEQLENSLHYVNGAYLYKGNIEFLKIEPSGFTRNGGEKWNVRLRAIDSAGPGGRRSATGRRIANACCWHAHGYFIESLPTGSSVSISSRSGFRVTKTSSSAWTDWNIGTNTRPFMMSEACECNGGFYRPLYDNIGRRIDPGDWVVIPVIDMKLLRKESPATEDMVTAIKYIFESSWLLVKSTTPNSDPYQCLACGKRSALRLMYRIFPDEADSQLAKRLEKLRDLKNIYKESTTISRPDYDSYRFDIGTGTFKVAQP